MSEWTLDLPAYVSPPLRDNDRAHWAVKASKTRQLRENVYWLAVAARLPKDLGRARIVLHWQPTTVRRRDQLSIAPTLKPLVDGLVDYGLIVDDDSDHAELSCRIEPVGKPSRVWLSITDLTA